MTATPRPRWTGRVTAYAAQAPLSVVADPGDPAGSHLAGVDGSVRHGGAGHTDGGFVHQALLHAGDDGFLAVAVGAIGDALARGQSVVAYVTARKVELLRSALGPAASAVTLADMGTAGRNPTRIISLWREAVADRQTNGRGTLGIGEPVWPGRSAAELVECRHHEAMLNMAFADAGPFRLVCPYDTDALDPAVVDDVYRTHPSILTGALRSGPAPGAGAVAAAHRSPGYAGVRGARAALHDPLPPFPERAAEMVIGSGRLSDVRGFVSQQAAAAGLGARRSYDLTLAVSELATNTLMHGGGRGTLRAWRAGATLVHEVRDTGAIREPLVGCRRPGPGELGGRGLWLVNELCDLVQLRSFADGTAVRLHMHTG